MKVLRTQKSARILSLIFLLIGIIALSTTVWKTWSQISSAENPFSTFLTVLWTEKLDFIPGLEFKLIYLVILGDVTLILGAIMWILSRQWLHLAGKVVCFQCPFCRKKWKATGDKALVHCPHCRQLVHPTMVEK